jgi:hypothetical protein
MNAVAGPSSKPIRVTYCGVCSLPTEYCEFGSRVSKCKAWLEEVDPVEYERVWGQGEFIVADLLPREHDSVHWNTSKWYTGWIHQASLNGHAA